MVRLGRGLEISLDGIIEEAFSVCGILTWMKEVEVAGWFLGRAHSCQREWNKCQHPGIPKVVVGFGWADSQGGKAGLWVRERGHKCKRWKSVRHRSGVSYVGFFFTGFDEDSEWD